MKAKGEQPKVIPANPKTKTVGLIAAAVVFLGGIAWYSLRPTDAPPAEAQRGQTSAPAAQLVTLSPGMFLGSAREAYQVAKDIPEVLQQLQCYCGCKESAGHQNNLYCFTDGHGAG